MIKMSKRVITFILAICLILSATLPTNVYAAKKVALNKTEVTLNVGETVTLKVKNAPKGKKITWSSNKKAVASVNQNGKVTAQKAGSCKITAKVANKKYQCSITVKAKAANTANKIAKYIAENGYKRDGYKTIGIDSSDFIDEEGMEIFISYIDDSNVLKFSVRYTDTEDQGTWMDVIMMYDIDTKTVNEAAILLSIGGLDGKASANLDVSTYSVLNTDLNFKAKAGFPIDNATCNDIFMLSFALWESVLSMHGFSLSDLGFNFDY